MSKRFFQGTVFLYFTKLVAAIHSLMGAAFILEQHLQPWIVFWQILLFKTYCNFKVALASIQGATVIISGGQFQPSSIFKLLSFFERSTWNRLCFQKNWVNSQPVSAIHSSNKRTVVATHSFSFTVFFQNRRSCSNEISQLFTIIPPWFQAWKLACYLTTSIPANHFLYGIVIISQEHLKRSIMSRALCLFCTKYCNSKQSVEKILRVECLFKGSSCSPALLKLRIYSTELVVVIFICSHPIF